MNEKEFDQTLEDMLVNCENANQAMQSLIDNFIHFFAAKYTHKCKDKQDFLMTSYINLGVVIGNFYATINQIAEEKYDE
jgi:hypothetical protein